MHHLEHSIDSELLMYLFQIVLLSSTFEDNIAHVDGLLLASCVQAPATGTAGLVVEVMK